MYGAFFCCKKINVTIVTLNNYEVECESKCVNNKTKEHYKMKCLTKFKYNNLKGDVVLYDE